MMKSTLFALACFLLVSIAVGDNDYDDDDDGFYTSSTIPPLPPLTASDVCMSHGHDAACTEVSREICKSLTCWGPDGVVAYLGKAPDGMWCGNGYICDYGECIEYEHVVTPTKNLELVQCP